MAKTKLQAPPGRVAVSHGGETYKIPKSGIVTVPEEAAIVLVESHGFVHLESDAPEETDPPEGDPKPEGDPQ